MKYLIFFLGVISLVSCNNNDSCNYTNKSMTETEWTEYRSSAHNDMIAIETNFEPTLELTDEIINTSLEELIKQNKGKYSKKEQLQRDKEIEKIIKEEGTTMEFAEFIYCMPKPISPFDINNHAEVKFKFVPSTSALAKVYYLEDMGGFIRNNSDFYYNVSKEVRIEAEEQREKEILDKWDKYL